MHGAFSPVNIVRTLVSGPTTAPQVAEKFTGKNLRIDRDKRILMCVRTTLQYNGFRVAVRSNDLTALAWLKSFLIPSFELDNVTAGDCDVSLQVGLAEHHKLYQRGPGLSGARVACFTRDGKPHLHPRWLGRHEEEVIYDEEYEVFYCFSAKVTAIRIVAARLAGRSRIALMRVVRELATSDSLRKGHLPVHGSAFAVGDNCVIISGPKGAGKSTLLLSALQGGADGLLANDRLFVNLGGLRPYARGMPTIVKIWEDSIRMFPSLVERIKESMYPDRLTLRGSGRWRYPSAGASGRLRYLWTPAQLCDLLGARPRGEAPLSAIVFPTIVPERSPTLRLEPLSQEVSARKLLDGLVRPSVEPAVGLYATGGASNFPDQDQLATACESLVSRVKCFECQMGPAGIRDPASVGLFLSRLLA